ncbi:MAG: permease-like cell division protein FtsX [Patescibacteria group bacterium]
MNFKRIIRSGFINFWRSGIVSLSSVVILTTTLFTIGGLFLGQAMLKSSLTALENKVDISVSFEKDATETEVLALKKQLEFLPTVKTVAYSSREEELADFRERNKDNAVVTQSLDEVGNPLGARLVIQALDPNHYDSIVDFLEGDDALSPDGRDLIYGINYKKVNIDNLLVFMASVRRLGLAVFLVLVFISVIAVFSTIALAIHVSREEIAIMRLVGADNAYVRGPFIIEGVIAGLLASFFSIGLLYPAVLWVRGATIIFADRFDLVSYYLSHFAILFLIILGAGMGLSVVASFLAVRKYLKV